MLGADLAHIEIIQAVFADFQFFLKRRSIAGYVTDPKGEICPRMRDSR